MTSSPSTNYETSLAVIRKLVSYYEKNYAAMTIEQLMNMRDRLAGNLFFFAEICGSLKYEYNRSVFTRKIHVLRERQAMRKSNPSITEARAKDESEHETRADFESEIESEARSYSADLILKQGNRILEALSQRISYLKKEYDSKIGV